MYINVTTWLIPTVTIIIAIISAVAFLYMKITGRLREIELELKGVSTKMSPLWKHVEMKIAAELHHDNPRYLEMDLLLEDLLSLRISSDGRRRLHLLLDERIHDPGVSTEEQKSAEILIAVMDKVLIEASTLTDKIVNGTIVLLFWTSLTLGNAIRNWR